MAEEPEEAEATDEEAEDKDGGGAPKRRMAGRTLVLFVIAPLLLVGGSGAAVFFLDPLGLFGDDVVMETTEEEEVAKPVIFYEMPELLVNLSNKDKRSQFLKLRVALEMSDRETRSAIVPVLPRIMDIFQVHLRELRSEDLEGSAGVYRLKEALLRRINLVLTPRKIDRILFKEMIVQ